MLKNSKDFKRKIFSNICKVKFMTLKIVAVLAVVNVIAFSGINIFKESAEASDTNMGTKVNENVTFIPSECVQANLENDSEPEVQEIVCSSTAYTGGGRTATGIACRRDADGISTISVDPSVIPLGTKVYVEDYGYALAADTGSSVKGKKIDVYFNSLSDCYQWGRKNVKVKIIQ